MSTITPFEAYQREWQRRGESLFFETMRAHPTVFRGRFPLLYDLSEYAARTFEIQDR